MVINTRLKSNVAFVRQLSMKLSRGSFPASDPASSLPNPDEHDAEGSGAQLDEESSPATERQNTS